MGSRPRPHQNHFTIRRVWIDSASRHTIADQAEGFNKSDPRHLFVAEATSALSDLVFPPAAAESINGMNGARLAESGKSGGDSIIDTGTPDRISPLTL